MLVPFGLIFKSGDGEIILHYLLFGLKDYCLQFSNTIELIIWVPLIFGLAVVLQRVIHTFQVVSVQFQLMVVFWIVNKWQYLVVGPFLSRSPWVDQLSH